MWLVWYRFGEETEIDMEKNGDGKQGFLFCPLNSEDLGNI